MKKLNVILFAVLMIFVTSCGDDDNDNDNDNDNDVVDNVGSGSIVANIDGTQIEFKDITGAKALGIIAIGGESGDVRISMLLDGDIQEGTYSDDDLPVMTFTNDGGDTGLLSQSGSLIITKHNETSNIIEGTFDVEFSNFGYTGEPVSVKGSFKIEYVDASGY